ncbi:MAG TPA: hypothetical protein PK926_17505 [Spirochaetota bacterium]|nr:hypothetical protein [Spirochaetota bacterium]HPI91112.1 hypothetical protein [Spirochaetota bacterium]HPR47708.1 hypothetical protein [Spirochaetota bacterium]
MVTNTEGRDTLNEKIKKLYEALSFYASDTTHTIFVDEKGFLITEYIKDNGKIAKQALASFHEQEVHSC